MDLGGFLLLLGISYALGILWYSLIVGKVPATIWRIAAYPFLFVLLAQATIGPEFTWDAKIAGFGVVTVLIGSLVGVVIDWLITTFRPAAK